MGRSLWLIAVLLFLGACTSAANAPAVDLTTTTTPSARDSSRSGCQTSDDVPVPGAVLSYGDQRQDDAMVSVNWRSDDCAANFHPSVTVPLAGTALEVPLGASPELTLSAEPNSVSGYAWRPDFSLAEELLDGKVEAPMDDLRSSTRTDLSFEPVVSQQLDLSSLAPGEYAIEVFADWEDGSAGWAFHVEIREP